MYLLRSSRANATGSFPAWPPSPYRPSGRTARPGSFPRVRGCEGESDGEGRQRKGGQRKAEIAELRAELLLMVEVMLEQFPPKREASSAGVFLFLAGRGPRSIRMGKNTATTTAFNLSPTFRTSSSSTFLKVLTLITAAPSFSHEAGSL